jgi:hypothetical protein
MLQSISANGETSDEKLITVEITAYNDRSWTGTLRIGSTTLAINGTGLSVSVPHSLTIYLTDLVAITGTLTVAATGGVTGTLTIAGDAVAITGTAQLSSEPMYAAPVAPLPQPITDAENPVLGLPSCQAMLAALWRALFELQSEGREVASVKHDGEELSFYRKDIRRLTELYSNLYRSCGAGSGLPDLNPATNSTIRGRAAGVRFV